MQKQPLPWPRSIVANVLFCIEAGEEVGNERMVNFCKLGVGHQVLPRSVGDARRSVHEDMVPGLIAIGLSLVLPVPGFVRATNIVDGDNDSAVTVTAMLNQHSNFVMLALSRIIQSNHSISRFSNYYSPIGSAPA